MTEKDKPTVLLEYYLKKLRLPTMLREYASMAAVCQKDQSDFSTYLLRLVERELLDRENRAAERRVKDASFPVGGMSGGETATALAETAATVSSARLG